MARCSIVIMNIRLFMCLFFFMSVMLSGCGSVPTSKEEPEEEEVRLSANEVLQKSQKVMSSLYGYHVLTKGQIRQTLHENIGPKNEQYTLEFDQKFNQQPYALHSIQKEVKQDGSTTTTESYVENGEAYKPLGPKWVKTKMPNAKAVLSQDPTDLLNFALQANGQGIQIKKEAGAYRLILDQTAGKGYLKQFIIETRKQFFDKGKVFFEDDFRIEKFQQVIWIDDKTFKFKKMKTEVDYTVYHNWKPLRVENHFQVDYKGDYNQQISVPSRIKNQLLLELATSLRGLVAFFYSKYNEM